MERTIIIHQHWRVIETIDSHTYYFEDRSKFDREPALIKCKEVPAKVNQQNMELCNEDDFSKLYDEFIENKYYDVMSYWGSDEKITKSFQNGKVSLSKADYINRIKEILYEDLTQLASDRFVTSVRSEIFHIIRQSEVESFYEYTSSIVINGIECNDYVDAEVGHFGYLDKYPNYIEIDGSKYKEVIATIPQKDLKLIQIGFDPHDGIFHKYIIPKKYIDKIILRRKYLHTDLIEFCLEKFYTGEEDVFELDPKNPNPKVLEMMKKYGVIKEIQ